MNSIFKVGCLTVLLVSSGCASMTGQYSESAIGGGVGGAVVGAGTGALIGAAIPNGVIGESALLGGAIGIPVGIVAAVMYQKHQEQKVLDTNNEIIRKNYRRIVIRDLEINQLREELKVESDLSMPDPADANPHYNGPTIGTYRR